MNIFLRNACTFPGRDFMKKCLRDVLLFGIFIFFFQQLNGQGITRSYGLGFRAGFWKRQDKTMSIHVSSDFMNSSGSGSVNVGGVGGSLYFFSRLAPRWFLEASIGASADVHVEQINFFSDEVDVAVLMPFLFGFRFDVLPTRIASNFQPYLSGHDY